MKRPRFTHSCRMHLRHLVLCCWLLLIFQASPNAQNSWFKSPTSGILGSSGAMEKSPWAFFSNPAGLSELPTAIAGIGYQNDFHLKELSARTAFVSAPFRTVNFSGGFSHSGYQYFNTQQYSLALAKKLAPWLNMGLRFNYHNRHFSDNQNAQLITLDAGWQLAPSEKIHLGFYALNPARSQWHLADLEEDHGPLLATSVAYFPVSALQLELGLAKEMVFPPTFSFMLSSQLHKNMILKGSAASAPLRFGLGSGIVWQNIHFDMGLAHHETLGFSSAFGLLYRLAKPTKP